MKALILAAGRGTRLGALTADCPKPMLPIGGVPMLERIMSGIAEEAGIREFVLVTGYLGEKIQSYFGNGSDRDWRVEYVAQPNPKGVGHAVLCAQAALHGGSFLLTYGDIMVDPGNYGVGRRVFTEGDSDRQALIGLNWVPDPWAGAAVTVDGDRHVRRIQEKPKPGTSTTNWNNAGLLFLRPGLFDFLPMVGLSARGEIELADALQAMVDAGLTVDAFPLAGKWRDVGTPEDYAAINAELGGIGTGQL